MNLLHKVMKLHAFTCRKSPGGYSLILKGMFFGPFRSENGLVLCPFWCGFGYGFRGTKGVYEKIYLFYYK